MANTRQGISTFKIVVTKNGSTLKVQSVHYSQTLQIPIYIGICIPHQFRWHRSMAGGAKVQTRCVQEEGKKYLVVNIAKTYEINVQVCYQLWILACLGGIAMCQCPSIWTPVRGLAKEIFRGETFPFKATLDKMFTNYNVKKIN